MLHNMFIVHTPQVLKIDCCIVLVAAQQPADENQDLENMILSF